MTCDSESENRSISQNWNKIQCYKPHAIPLHTGRESSSEPSTVHIDTTSWVHIKTAQPKRDRSPLTIRSRGSRTRRIYINITDTTTNQDSRHAQHVILATSTAIDPICASLESQSEKSPNTPASTSSADVLLPANARSILDTQLAAIITISRLSCYSKYIPILESLNKRNHTLFTLALETHRRAHLHCLCTPNSHTFILNGLSSNESGSPKSTRAFLLQPIISVLEQYRRPQEQVRPSQKQAQTPQEKALILFVISTSDGFLTNPVSLNTFFSPFLDLNLVYTVIQQHGRPCFVFTVQDLSQAINDIYKGILKSAPSYLFIQEITLIAVGKSLLGRGKSIVTSQIKAATPVRSLLRTM